MVFTTITTEVTRGANLRRVFVTFPNVAPPGVEWTARHGGRRFELTSYKGAPVELYVFNETTGLPMYQGTIRRYAGGEELREAFRKVWCAAQPSKSAREAFEVSARELFV